MVWRRDLEVVLGGHVGDQVDNALGVSPLVVVPGNKLDKVVVQGDTGLGVEDGGVVITNKVGGDDILLCVVENALLDIRIRQFKPAKFNRNSYLEVTGSSLLDGILDILILGGLLKPDDEIDNRDIRGWDTERHSGKFAIQGWDDLSDSLGSTS